MIKDKAATRVILVDDHPVIRQGLSGLLQDEGFQIVGIASNISETVELLAKTPPTDVAVVDLSLENESGFDVLALIRKETPKVTTVVYSVHEDIVNVRRALKLGAMGYVTKREDPEVLVDCINKAHAGERYLSPRAAHFLADALAGNGEKAPDEVLSPQEMQVYTLMGKGIATPDIADSMGISARTVETYYSRILFKLGLPGRRDLLQHAIEYARLSSES